MNEMQAIVAAYADARARGERAALATVVSVVGSAYRRPGARMLITESGQTVGAISGGCLERDVVERARQVIASGAPRIVEYDTRGAEDIVWGLGLGCNGVVRVLLESLHEGSSGARALQFIADLLRARQCGVVATVIAAGQATNGERITEQLTDIGARCQFDEEELSNCEQSFVAARTIVDVKLATRIRADARAALAAGRAMTRVYEAGARQTEIFFDVISRPRALVIFGAEHDAVPVMQLAHMLGWHVTIVDTRARSATRERFRAADAVIPCRAEDVASCITFTRDTAAVVMTHNYLDDVELLRALLPSPASYIGLLGPKQRTEKLLKEVGAEDFSFADAHHAHLHGPVGIDIGAETPEEIALAVVAEIKAVWAGRRAGFLRDRTAPIHDECPVRRALLEFTSDEHLSARARATGVVCGSA
jgi:xanthine dehydrogenase accessory factor